MTIINSCLVIFEKRDQLFNMHTHYLLLDRRVKGCLKFCEGACVCPTNKRPLLETYTTFFLQQLLQK